MDVRFFTTQPDGLGIRDEMNLVSALRQLKPEFRGLTISCYPHDDDITLYLFHTLVRRYGWEWMDKYIANGAAFIQGHLGVARAVSAGDKSVSIDSNPNLSLREKRAGKPTRVARDSSATPGSARRGVVYALRSFQ